MKREIALILKYLEKHRGVDFSGYRPTILARRIDQRINKIGSKTIQEYSDYLQSHPQELDNLSNCLTINSTGFFRDPLVFEYLSSIILPGLLYEKIKNSDNLLRVWSAGCSTGEEPYSIAMEISELLQAESNEFKVNIFATDVNENVLNFARIALYEEKNLESIRYRQLKYFIRSGGYFNLTESVKGLVSFSQYDLLDRKNFAPPESVYAGFDIVLCRNVLIYFDGKNQDRILKKLYRSLSPKGYLVLGESEVPSIKYAHCFRKVSECCHIYQKQDL